MSDDLRSTTATGTELGPENAVLLTALDTDAAFREASGACASYKSVVDDGPGVYAAWLLDPEGLGECGIMGPPPVALYVATAVTGGGLADRIREHVWTTWLELAELLALEGRVLSPFAGRRGLRKGEERRDEEDPMTDLTIREARAWQHDRVSWSWVSCRANQAAAVARDAIRSRDPVLNTAGMPSYPPPLLRSIVDPRLRAQWLWHMSWAGLLIGDRRDAVRASDQERWQVDDPACGYQADELGYPIVKSDHRGAEPTVRRSDCPDGDSLWGLFVDAAQTAPGRVRHALGSGMKRDELQVWWAAHAAAPLLPNPVSVRDAIAASLELTPARDRPGPPRLPSAARCEELRRLARRLTRPKH